MATLGRAFVEVRADTSKFPDDVRRAMRKLSADARQDSDKAGKLMGERVANSLRESLSKNVKDKEVKIDLDVAPASILATEATLRRVTRNREVDVTINRRRLGSSVSAAGGTIARGLATFTVSTIRILGDFFNFGRQIGQVLGEAFGGLIKAAGGAGKATLSLGAAMTQLAATVIALSAVLFIMVGIFGILLAAVGALYEALLLVVVLAPGLGLAFLLALAPLVLLFSNLSNAIGAVSDDTHMFDEKISNLGESTRSTLRFLRQAVQFFGDMRAGLQDDFFTPVSRALKELDTELGPTFERGFSRIATAAGNFAAAFISLFDHPNTRNFFDQLFQLGELGFEEIGGAGVELVGAIANLIDQTFPEAREAIFGIGSTIEGWADSINSFADSPNLDDKLEQWQVSFETIMTLMGSIVELADLLFQGFHEDGLPVLLLINTELQKFITYLESPAGQDFMDGLRIAAMAVVVLLLAMVQQVVRFVELIGIAEDLISGDFSDAINQLNQNPLAVFFGIVGRILGLFMNMEDSLARVEALLIVFGVPLNIILSIAGGIRNLWRSIRDFISASFDRLRRLIGVIRGTSSAFGPVVGAAQAVASAIGNAVGLARNLINLLSTASSIGGGTVGKLGKASFNAAGGIFTRPTLGVFGEAGAEAIIPLTRPGRAMELMNQSGLTNLVRGGDGAATADSGLVMAQLREMQLRMELLTRQRGELIIKGDGSLFSRAVQQSVLHGVRTNPAFARKVRGH